MMRNGRMGHCDSVSCGQRSSYFLHGKGFQCWVLDLVSVKVMVMVAVVSMPIARKMYVYVCVSVCLGILWGFSSWNCNFLKFDQRYKVIGIPIKMQRMLSSVGFPGNGVWARDTWAEGFFKKSKRLYWTMIYILQNSPVWSIPFKDFLVNTQLCNHHHNPTLKHFHHPKKTPRVR